MITKMPRLSARDAASITTLAVLTVFYFVAWGYLAESEAPKHAWLVLWAAGAVMLSAWLQATIIIEEVICGTDSKIPY